MLCVFDSSVDSLVVSFLLLLLLESLPVPSFSSSVLDWFFQGRKERKKGSKNSRREEQNGSNHVTRLVFVMFVSVFVLAVML